MELLENGDERFKKKLLLEALQVNEFLSDDEIWRIVNDSPTSVIDMLLADGLNLREWEYADGDYFYWIEK